MRCVQLASLALAVSLFHAGARAEPAVPRQIRVGDTVRIEMPAGDPRTTSLVFEFRTDALEPVTVDIRSLDFEVDAKVFSTGEGLTPLSPAHTARARDVVTFSIKLPEPGTYRIVLRAGDITDRGGYLEVSLGKSSKEPAPSKVPPGEALRFWKEVERDARRSGNHLRAAHALERQGLLDAARGTANKARHVLEDCLALREDVFGRQHPAVARTLNFLAGSRFRQVATRRPGCCTNDRERPTRPL